MYYREKREYLQNAFEDAFKKKEKKTDSGCCPIGYYLDDFSDEKIVCNYEGKMYEVGYTASEDMSDIKFDEKSKWVEVIEKKEYEPVGGAPDDKEETDKQPSRKDMVKEMIEE